MTKFDSRQSRVNLLETDMPEVKRTVPFKRAEPGAQPSPSRPGPAPGQVVQAPAAGGGVLSRIRSVATQPLGALKFNIYGDGKTGKTRFACTFPKPLLLIGTEDGTKSVIGTKGVDFVQVETVEEFVQLVAHARDKSYRTVVLDTAGGLQDMILKEHLGLDEIPVAKTWGLTDQQNWGVVGMQFGERMRQLFGLCTDSPGRQGAHVVVIAHERTFEPKDKTQVHLVKIGSALTPKAAQWLNSACDYVCQMYKRPEVRTVRATDGAFEGQEVTERTGRTEYVMRTGPSDLYMTGFRVPIGVVLPDDVPDPNYEKVLAVVEGKYGRPAARKEV